MLEQSRFCKVCSRYVRVIGHGAVGEMGAPMWGDSRTGAGCRWRTPAGRVDSRDCGRSRTGGGLIGGLPRMRVGDWEDAGVGKSRGGLAPWAVLASAWRAGVPDDAGDYDREEHSGEEFPHGVVSFGVDCLGVGCRPPGCVSCGHGRISRVLMGKLRVRRRTGSVRGRYALVQRFGEAFSMMFRQRRRRRRGRYWHDPEWLEGQAERDAQLGRTTFYVYVLGTDYGHYVGHTWNVRNRVAEHQQDEVPSTAGGDPVLLWQSRAFQTREDAAGFEAALKSWRDSGSPRFRETTGHEPEYFDNPNFRRAGAGFRVFGLPAVGGACAGDAAGCGAGSGGVRAGARNVTGSANLAGPCLCRAFRWNERRFPYGLQRSAGSPSAGRRAPSLGRRNHDCGVSTLKLLDCWLLSSGLQRSRWSHTFQSSPALKGGCYLAGSGIHGVGSPVLIGGFGLSVRDSRHHCGQRNARTGRLPRSCSNCASVFHHHAYARNHSGRSCQTRVDPAPEQAPGWA